MSDLVQAKYSSPLALWLIDLSKLLHMQPTAVKHLVESANEIENQAKEIAQLRANDERMRIEAIPQRRDALDAERYRWLRVWMVSDDLYDSSVANAATVEQLDAAIDALRAGEKS